MNTHPVLTPATTRDELTVNNRRSGQPKGFVLEHLHANLLLLNQVYFIIFPNIYVFEKHGIICRVDDGNRYHEVDTLKPNPPKVESVLNIENVTFRFDRHRQLWRNLDGQWFMEVTYTNLESTRAELARSAERS
ncbi:hypothetical protein FRC07_007803 [Ceratobasidium sp. 392]|nr:hypothetical protein FRC07_007803 [Ceratobasidium sp. 392]